MNKIILENYPILLGILALVLWSVIFLLFVFIDYALNRLGFWAICNSVLQKCSAFIGTILFDEKERGIPRFIWLIISLLLLSYLGDIYYYIFN